jgi:hypothetical protein
LGSWIGYVRGVAANLRLLVSNFTTIIRLLRSLIMGINSSAIAAIIKIFEDIAK